MNAETYVAAIFPERRQAEALGRSLAQLAEGGALTVYGVRLYRGAANGNVEPDGPEDDGADIDEEAADELAEHLAEGHWALLAHLAESDPSIVDSAVRAAGGALYRRSDDALQASGFHRFIDAAEM